MKEIILKSTAFGPNCSLHPGNHTVDDAFADGLVKGGYAEYSKAVVSPPEKQVVAPKEKAIVSPPEVRSEGKPALPPEKVTQGKPVSTVGSNKAPTWGSPKAN